MLLVTFVAICTISAAIIYKQNKQLVKIEKKRPRRK